MSPDDSWDVKTAAAGRSSLSVSRDEDWESFVKAVRGLPQMRLEKGEEITIAWAQTELASLLDILNLADPNTHELAIAQSAIYLYFTEGVIRVMMRDDYAGFNRRAKFLRAVERWMVHHTFKAVFRSSLNDTTRRPYVPQLQELEPSQKGRHGTP